MPVGFTRIKVQNWRVWKDLDLRPPDSRTWVVGRNGSGKTALLDAIAFPCDLVRAGAFTALSGELRHAPGVGQCTLASQLWDSSEPASWDLEFEVSQEHEYRYHLSLRARLRGIEVLEERLERRDGADWRSVLERGPSGARLWGRTASGLQWMPVAPDDSQSLLRSAVDPVQYPEIQPAVAFLSGVWMLRPVPLLMRTGLGHESGPPDRYGRDFTALLDNAISGFPTEIGGWLQDLEEVTGFKNVRVRADDGARHAEFQEGHAWLPFRLASDGQLLQSYIALLGSFLPPEATVVLLDEPSVALSPEAQEALAQWMRFLSEVVQTLAVTHSTPLLNEGASRGEILTVRRKPGQPAELSAPLADYAGTDRVPGLFKAGEVAERSRRGLLEVDSADG